MAASSRPPDLSSYSLDDLRDHISFNEILLETLESDFSSEADQEKSDIQNSLRLLREQVQSRSAIPSWGATGRNMESDSSASTSASMSADHRPGSSASSHDSAPTPNTDPGNMAPPSFLALPSRKRQRSALDHGDDETEYPDLKSLRPSPTISAAASPVSATESFDFSWDDDPIMQALLGDNIREELREGKKYMTELEKKRQQEKEDEEFARTLQDSFNQPTLSSSQGYRASSSNYTQAFFHPDGSTYRAIGPRAPSPKSIKPQPSSSTLSSTPYPYSIPRMQASRASLSDSDSDIEEISAQDFSPHMRFPSMNKGFPSAPIAPPQMLFAPRPAMPGSFPHAAYSGMGGSSVYGATGPSDIFSLIDQDLGGFASAYSGMPGSMNSPYDIEAYTSRLQDYYSDPTKTEEEIRELIKHIRPDEDLKPEEREGTPEQMKFPLMEHQKLGLTWMKKMEEGTNRGGILADDMGLGKTIQALALVVSRPAPEGTSKPTLVVAPVALMEQWKREAKKMIKREFALDVFILHGDSRQTSWNILKRKDIILTTYGMLASELKRKVAWEEKVKMYPDARPTNAEYCPILGEQSNFHRIVLDEAQWIKNRATKSAIAACMIKSTYRWCMSGTPMQNKVEELHSLIKFCRIKPYNELEKFSRDFARPLKGRVSQDSKDKAMRALQALLKAILLRRTKTSTIDGKPILSLPPKTITEARAVFSPDEAEFYKALEGKAQLVFNRFMKAGTVGRNYSNVLVLLLRLRQACCHPHLIKDFAINTGAAEGVDLLENARGLSKEVVERIRRMEAFECPICIDAAVNPILFNPCGHALCDECLAKLVDRTLSDGEGAEPACPHCRAKVNTMKVTDYRSFLRVFCPEKIGVHELLMDETDVAPANKSQDDSEDDSDGEDEDNEDNGHDLKDFIVDDEDDVEYDSNSGEDAECKPNSNAMEKSERTKVADKMANGSKKSKKGKGKRKDKDSHKSLAQLRKDGLKNKAAKKKYLKRLKKDFQTSAKIDKTVSLLEEIHARGTGEKTIIFSGFTSFLDLLEVPLHSHPDLGNYARYDGSMSAKSRNGAVLEFTDNQHCRIMLVSLKAGNAGLNLTAASQVIILDPHWNPFVEMQAADRAYRIGQMRPVEIHRVLIDGEGLGKTDDGTATVEDRILALQEKKRQLVENALDENAGNSIARLGVRELGYLFGVNSMNNE